jgi:hypothetical protein
MIRGVGTFAVSVRPTRFRSTHEGGVRRDFAVYVADTFLESARLTCITIEPAAADFGYARIGTLLLLDARAPIPLHRGLCWEMGAAPVRRLTPAVPLTLELRARAKNVRPPRVVVWFDNLERRWDSP